MTIYCICFSDLHDLLTDLSASTFRQTQKTTNQTPKPSICERRFSNYKFTRSDVPETAVLWYVCNLYIVDPFICIWDFGV